ncbi:hypothetical protein Syun_001618 [Stephania yunnanensis]|uniref:YTH domain-containing family protein n=1 Tax=Stephania yunnanensis TaxID=152371 RepID=A0AAP0Q7A0_9MAGN
MAAVAPPPADRILSFAFAIDYSVLGSSRFILILMTLDLSSAGSVSFTVIYAEAADLLQNLSLDSQNKALEVPEPVKKSATIPRGNDGGVGNSPFHPADRSTTPILPDFTDPTMCYLPGAYSYYYGYDANDWDDYSRFVNPDGVEIPAGVYGDNGSLMYHGYGYAPYGAYSPAGSPVPTIAHDGQLYGPQHYQYPTPFYQTPTPPPNGSFAANQNAPSQGEINSSIPADQGPLSADVPKGNGTTKINGNGSVPRQTHQSSALNTSGSYARGMLPGGIPASSPQDGRYGFDGARSLVPWLDGLAYSNGQPRPATSTAFSSSVGRVQPGMNQTMRPLPNFMSLPSPRPNSGMGSAAGFINRMYPNQRIYSHYGSTTRAGTGYGSNGYNARTNGGRGWFSVDSKYKPKGGNGYYGYGNESMDGLNELNRGPRARGFKNQKGFAPVTLAVKGQVLPLNGNGDDKDSKSTVPNREQYNREDFSVNYTEAKFFIIKSYSEDDIHKSIKYSVWASTPNGNKKLDGGYQEAQEKSGDCPVFLFFSVNTSGQFVGLAEMVGPVDFNKSVDYWQQDKWNGCFPLKWHIVKDVPNNLLKHIILENNDSKPVTNSRDTQEVNIEQGLEMLKIFKEHSSKTCILDDFGFYEVRQKTLQEKRAKQQLQKQAWDGKSADAAGTDGKPKEGTLVKLGSLKSSEDAPVPKEPVVVQAPGEAKQQSEENGTGAKLIEVTENGSVVNGLANGC